MRSILVILSASLIFSCANRTATFKPQAGDLLFQDLDCGKICDAIETVTTGVDSAKLSHVGIVGRIDNKGEVYVIEAYEGVKEVPLEKFLRRSADPSGRPKVLVGRLLPQYQGAIPVAVQNAYKLIGAPYDSMFVLGDNSYYCSELVYEAFKTKDAKDYVTDLFPLNKMTFKDPATGKIMDVWKKYFKELGIAVPEGKPGINPGAISMSPKLQIVYSYGCPGGWTKCK